MIGRPPGRRRLDPVEPKLGQIERIDERVDHPNRIVLVDPVIEAFGQQRRLPAIRPLNEALHPSPANREANHTSSRRFHTARVIPGSRGPSQRTSASPLKAAELSSRREVPTRDLGTCGKVSDQKATPVAS